MPWNASFDQEAPSSSTLTGLHFIFCLCLYDTMLSWVLLSHSSLLADLAIDTEDRAKCNMFASIMGSVGSNSVFLANMYL
jgi:hypothetical protein